MDPEVRVCDPFEARDFNKEIEFMRADICKVIDDENANAANRCQTGFDHENQLKS